MVEWLENITTEQCERLLNKIIEFSEREERRKMRRKLKREEKKKMKELQKENKNN